MNIKNLKKSKVALTICTGRPNVKKVVKSFLSNAKQHGYDLKKFSVYLAVDRAFQNAEKEDFYLSKNTENIINKVTYIFEEDREKISEEIISKFLLNETLIKKLFLGRGYSKQRNSALLMALKDGNDFAICVDDDEAPCIPVKDEEGTITWENPDFFTNHLQAMAKGADVTRGPYIGYLSPIPSDFEKDIPEEIRKKLGEALQIGNEVIATSSFFNLMNQIKYLDKQELEHSSRPFEVENTKHGKHIYAGNMGINLHSLKKGKIPLFYTPPSARGEDTIFALQLKDVNVVEVGSYIFHDPFNMYPQILNANYPEELRNIPVTTDTKMRFANALLGWLKYAPILILMTSKTPEERRKRINEMIKKIEFPTMELAHILDCSEIENCRGILKKYARNVLTHYKELNMVQKLWKEELSHSQLNTLELS